MTEKLRLQEVLENTPECLHHLPLIEKIPEIDFSKNFLLTSETGSGKSLLLATNEVQSFAGRKVYLRQPSRVTAYNIYSSLKGLFGDRIDIGILTSRTPQNKREEMRDSQIVLVSDGMLSYIFHKELEDSDVRFYEDELHSMISPTEIELSMINRELNRRIDEGEEDPLFRGLTATIDPNPLLAYMGLDKKENYYHATGRTFPISKKIINKPVEQALEEFAKDLKEHDKSAIAFVATRKETEDYTYHLRDIIQTEFIHAGEDPSKIEDKSKKYREEGTPVLFVSTVAASTGITVDIDDIFINDEMVWSTQEKGLQKIGRRPCTNNLILQMAGRGGRLSPCTVTLNTPNRRSWDQIKPENIEYPLERETPYSIQLMLAQYGIGDVSQFKLLSDIDIGELKYTKDYLTNHGIIKQNEFGNMELLSWGKKIMKLPLETRLSILLVKSEVDEYVELQPIIASAAIFGYDSIWGLLRNDPKNWKNKLPLPKELFNPYSEMLIKAKIMQKVIEENEKGRGSLFEYCKKANLDYKKIGEKIKEFEYVEKSYRVMKKKLIASNIDKLSGKFIEYLNSSRIMDIVSLNLTKNGNYTGGSGDTFCMLDSTSVNLLHLNKEKYVFMGRFNEVYPRANPDKPIRFLNCPSILVAH